MDSSLDKAKKAAGYAAAEIIQQNMTIGLGTGSTAAYFIERLGERCRQGLNIVAVATSQRSFKQAQKEGIPVRDIEHLVRLDLVVDGADEIDPQKRMIKGGGGALLREKIVASMSNEMIVVIDQQKQVKQLGAFPLPVEIVTFAWEATTHHIQQQGFSGKLRKNKEGETYITDNGNYIFDIHFPTLLTNPEEVDQKIRNIPGVIETGFFFHIAGRVIIGYTDGRTEIRT